MRRKSIDERERVGAEVSKELLNLSRHTATAHPDEMNVQEIRRRMAAVDRRLKAIGGRP